MHAGGWLTLPVVVFFAHLLNLDATPIFISIIFIRTVSAPFGLLLNEGMAVSKAKHDDLNIKNSFYIIIISQFIVLFVVEIFLKDSLKTNLVDDLLLISSCSLGSLFSYLASYRIYKLVIHGSVGKKVLSIISISPGISTLFIYFLYFFLGKDFERVLFLSLVIPGIIQLLLVYFCFESRQDFFYGILSSINKSSKEVNVKNKDVILTLVYIAILSVLMAHYRDDLIRNDIQYAAIVLTLVNAITSFFNLFIKYKFISGKGSINKNSHFLIVLIIFLVGANALTTNFFLLVITLSLLSAAVLLKMDSFRTYSDDKR